MIVGVAVAGIISFIVGKLVFTVVPAADRRVDLWTKLKKYNSTQPS